MRTLTLGGVFLFFIGTLLLLSSANGLTGLVVAEGVGVSASFTGLVLTLVGSALLVVGAREPEKKELEVLVSQGALQRSSQDKVVRSNLGRYVKEINKIKERVLANPFHTPQTEVIGEFHISPQGHVELRIAWHYDQEKGILYIDDLLYKKAQSRYVDDWAARAERGEITRRDHRRYQRMEEIFA